MGPVSGWRHQPPVYSPLSGTALLCGIRAAVLPARQESARQQVGALLGARYAPKDALLTDSGTTALTAALIGILRDRPGFAVALPAFACYDVATAADGADVPVLLYDVDPATLAPDLPSLRSALRFGAAAVVVVHLYGCPVDLVEVNRLAAQAGAIVIEDAAQAAGATLDDRPAGTLSALAVLSFGRGKGLTGGGGGALLAHNQDGERVIARARGLLQQPRRGWSAVVGTVAQWLLARPAIYGLPASVPLLGLGETVYRAPRPLRAPTGASCALVAATWQAAEREVEVRRRNAERLWLALQGKGELQAIRFPTRARPGYLRLPVLASPTARRAADRNRARRLGVMPGYPKALCDLQRFVPRCINRDATFRGSRILAARLCTLPTHSQLSPPDLERLELWIRAVGQGEPRNQA